MRTFSAAVLAAILALAHLPGEARAAGGGGAAQALQVITRARVADERCQFLTPDQHRELVSLAARAEASAAAQFSADVVASAVATGSSEGEVMSCTSSAHDEVTTTYNDSRQALARAATANPAPAPATPAPQPQPQPDEQAQSNQTAPQPDDTQSQTPPPAPSQPAPAAAGDLDPSSLARGRAGTLDFYTRQLAAYYLERKCQMLSANQDSRYWRAIARLHRQTVARNGHTGPRAIMARSEIAAARRDCDDQALSFIKAGFAASARF